MWGGRSIHIKNEKIAHLDLTSKVFPCHGEPDLENRRELSETVEIDVLSFQQNLKSIISEQFILNVENGGEHLSHYLKAVISIGAYD